MSGEALGGGRCPSCLTMLTVAGSAADGSDAHLECETCGLVFLTDE